MPFRYNVQIDLVHDFNLLNKKLLEDMGYRDINMKENIYFEYLNVIRRLVSVEPRNILLSKEFNCPKRYKKSFEILKNRIQNGKNVNQYLSKGVKKLNYHDDLLNDWGIHHFHLGSEFEKNSNFIRRTGPLLFVRFDNENAYFINIMKHGNWSNQELVKIIHRNWPETIKKYRLKGVKNIYPKPTNEEYGELRKLHISMCVEVEQDVIYMPIGMGYMSSGHSVEEIRKSFYCENRLRLCELYVKENIGNIVKHYNKYGVVLENKVIFFLSLKEKDIYIVESKSFLPLKVGSF